MRGPARIAVLITMILMVLLTGGIATAGSATAHAQLEKVDPPDGTRLERSPATVDLTFAQSVLLRAGSLQVVDRSGVHVQSGEAFHPGGVGNRVAVRLPSSLPDASYTVRFAVVSQDGHPVSGATSFVIGSGPLIGANGVPADIRPDRAVSVLYGLGRWLSFCGLAVLGGLISISTCWPARAGSTRARRLLGLGWLSAATGSVLSLLLLGPYGSEQGISAALSPSSFNDTLSLPVGKVLLLRLLALAALIPIAVRLLRAVRDGAHEARRRAESLGMAAAIPLLIGYSGASHAESGAQPTAVVLSDMLHAAAMSFWVGGVVMLALVVLPEAGADELSAALPVFSRSAFAAVCVLVTTGAFQAWQQVRSWPLLWQTEYGRTLLVKVLVVATVLLVGDQGRRAVQRAQWTGPAGQVPTSRGSRAPGDRPGTTAVRTDPTLDLQRLRAVLVAETAICVVILVLSAMLVAATPARLEEPARSVSPSIAQIGPV